MKRKPKLKLDKSYFERFSDPAVKTAFEGLRSLGWIFPLLKDGGKNPSGWWKHHVPGQEGCIDEAIDRTLNDVVGHLFDSVDHSIGVVPDGGGAMLLDVDVFRRKFAKSLDAEALVAKTFGEHRKNVLVLPSSRPNPVPKCHAFFKCDVPAAHSRWGGPHPTDKSMRIRIQDTETKHFAGQIIGRHYAKVHHPELLPMLFDWAKSESRLVPLSAMDKFTVGWSGAKKLKTTQEAIDAMEAEIDASPKAISNFEVLYPFGATQATPNKGGGPRHGWINANAASGAMRGYAREPLREKLSAETDISNPKESAGDYGEFDRFFDGGYDWGLSRRIVDRLQRGGRNCGARGDWKAAEKLLEEAAAMGVDADDANDAIDEGWEQGMDLRKFLRGDAGKSEPRKRKAKGAD